MTKHGGNLEEERKKHRFEIHIELKDGLTIYFADSIDFQPAYFRFKPRQSFSESEQLRLISYDLENQLLYFPYNRIGMIIERTISNTEVPASSAKMPS